MIDNHQPRPFSVQSSLSEIAILIESSKGAAALAEQKLWDIVQLHSESVPGGSSDLMFVARNLSATGLQFKAHLEIMQSFMKTKE